MQKFGHASHRLLRCRVHYTLYTPQTCRRCSEKFLKTLVFLRPTANQLFYASNKAASCRICYWHVNHYKTYGLHCYQQLLKIWLSKNKDHRTDLVLAEYGADTESIIKTMDWAFSSNFPKVYVSNYPQCKTLAQASKEQNIPPTPKALESRWFEEFPATTKNWSFPPTHNEKIRCATLCPKT